MTILNADKWLFATLTGDATLAAAIGARVYVDVAPQSNTQYPYIVMQMVSSVQVAEIGVERVMDDEVWQVALVSNAPSYVSLETIADRIKTVLHKASGTGVIGCVFEQLLRFSEDEAGHVYKTIVLEFRIFTQ